LWRLAIYGINSQSPSFFPIRVAGAFYGIAKDFCSRVAIYKVQELERFGKRPKQ
jgi:hypothetical protein